jgi:hypothetical protein
MFYTIQDDMSIKNRLILGTSSFWIINLIYYSYIQNLYIQTFLLSSITIISPLFWYYYKINSIYQFIIFNDKNLFVIHILHYFSRKFHDFSYTSLVDVSIVQSYNYGPEPLLPFHLFLIMMMNAFQSLR